MSLFLDSGNPQCNRWTGMSLLHSQPGLSILCFQSKMDNVFELLPNLDQERDPRRIILALAFASYPEQNSIIIGYNQNRTQSLLLQSEQNSIIIATISGYLQERKDRIEKPQPLRWHQIQYLLNPSVLVSARLGSIHSIRELRLNRGYLKQWVV